MKRFIVFLVFALAFVCSYSQALTDGFGFLNEKSPSKEIGDSSKDLRTLIRQERDDTLDYYPLKNDVSIEIGDTASNLRDLINTILYPSSRTATASDTLDLTDAYKIVRMNITTTANTITILQNSVVPFPVGTQITIMQAGTGQTAVVAGPGVTINSYNSALKLVGRYSWATLYQSSANTWGLFGQITN